MYTQDDHTFSICAYKESPYLEECIISIQKQSLRSHIIMTTSTPNDYIQALCCKYDIPLFIHNAPSNIASDWNFAYAKASTPLVTLCHQDDVYLPLYLTKLLCRLNKARDPLIAFSGYGELRNEVPVFSNTLLNIKKIMLLPLLFPTTNSKRLIKRSVLAFGNPLCCPAVTYVKNALPPQLFSVGFKSNIDWQTWEKLSRKKGSFVYIPSQLVLHRIHSDSTTSELIQNNERAMEDFAMFCCFWPKRFARILCSLYKKGQDHNTLSDTEKNSYEKFK